MLICFVFSLCSVRCVTDSSCPIPRLRGCCATCPLSTPAGDLIPSLRCSSSGTLICRERSRLTYSASTVVPLISLRRGKPSRNFLRCLSPCLPCGCFCGATPIVVIHYTMTE
ncbi:hypothetical protein PF006_g28279 [Phytophthora fragariae]|uniref:Secreted protein n=1 Tax=Phytophthora fragariae TaxID=53985 RepID=A0A6A3DFT9_9STRA|nr:hypothetical protein PF009_g30495 [Phytophthora fragariae]KAE9075728.1 hypothetical protein PF006_g28279 [Phytophthora fragariae]